MDFSSIFIKIIDFDEISIKIDEKSINFDLPIKLTQIDMLDKFVMVIHKSKVSAVHRHRDTPAPPPETWGAYDQPPRAPLHLDRMEGRRNRVSGGRLA